MPEVSDGVSWGIVAMLVTMFPEQMINSRQENPGVQAGLKAEMMFDSHGESPRWLIQESVIQEDQTPEQIIAKIQDNQTMTTMHVAEVWQGGGIYPEIAEPGTEWQEDQAAVKRQSTKGTCKYAGFVAMPEIDKEEGIPDKTMRQQERSLATEAVTGAPLMIGFAA